MKLGLQALQNSRKATAYMGNMILSILKNGGEYTVNAAQNIVQFKNTLAYKFLQTAVGQEALDVLADTKFAMHRYGLFIDTFNNDQKRQELKQDTYDAWMKGEISFEARELILGMDDPKKAGMVLSFEKWRSQQDKMKEQQAVNQAAANLEMMKHKNEMELTQLKGQLANQGKQIEAQGIVMAAKLGADAKLQAVQEKEDNEPNKQDIRANSKIKEAAAKKNLEMQEPV